MKVLQINSVCGYGSTGRIATDIHSELTQKGHDSYIAYGRGLPKNCDKAIRIGSKLDNFSHLASTRIFDNHGYGSKKATSNFIETVIAIDPDIIHLHNIHGYYINIEVLFNYLKTSNKVVVWTLHDCWSFTGHCSHFEYIGCEKWETGCFNCPQKQEYPKSVLFDNSKENYSNKRELFNGLNNLMLITPSNWLNKKVGNSFLSKYPVRVVNNGIDLSIFKYTKNNFKIKYKLQNKFMILGVASTWSEKKGLEEFLNLSQMIAPDDVIVLVGLTQMQLKSLPKNIIGITRTEEIYELAEIYSAADVFVNPTLEDTFPTVNMESIACGTPVITYKTGGSPEIVNSDCGIITEKKTCLELIHHINKIKNKFYSFNPKRMRHVAEKKFDKNNLQKEFIDIYRELLEVKR